MEDARLQEPAVPVGLEQVLLLAGVEPRVGAALAADPDAVLAASGVALTATERAILRTVDPARMEQMAARLVAAASEPTRRAFLGQASVLLVGLGAAAGLAGGCGDKPAAPGKAGVQKGSAAADMRAIAQKRQRELERRDRVRAPTGIRPRFPQLTVGDLVIKGPLDTPQIRRKLKLNRSAVKRCWLTKNPRQPPVGMLRVELTVDAKGKVSKASYGAGTLKNNFIESCILDEVRRWEFPPSRPRPTQIQIEYKFEYR